MVITRIISIFTASEMANPVFSVWSKTGPTLLRFLKGCLGNSLFVIQFRECCNEIAQIAIFVAERYQVLETLLAALGWANVE